MYQIVPCYVCGDPCWGPDYWHTGSDMRYCCLACAKIVYMAARGNNYYQNHTNPCHGDGFPHGEPWDKPLEAAKAAYGSLTKKPIKDFATAKPVLKKNYGDQCPCGMHPSQCEYHKDCQ